MRKNGYTVIELLIAIAFIGIVVVLLIAAMGGGCGAGAEGEKAVESEGFTDVQIGDRAWWGCGREDTFNSHFTALNAQGHRVSGTVCCGLLKGCTLRF